ncbi:MAG: Hsp20 family protein, partial [Gemmatimonadota bacterium]|nr:Hsp20 family protein [Gemmatimonadota bacterium]
MRTALPTRRRFFPWRETDDFENRLEAMFEEPFFTPTFAPRTGWMPTVDVAETEDALILTAELPGLTEEDIEIELEGNVLTLRGEKKEEMEDEKT